MTALNIVANKWKINFPSRFKKKKKKKISDIDSALERIRQCCPRISYVSLLGNPGCPDQLTQAPGTSDEDDYERYRLYAIYVLPDSLRFLDSRSITQQERIQAKSRGRFLRTVRVDAKVLASVPRTPSSDEFNEADFHVNYTPLPSSIRTPQDHKGDWVYFVLFSNIHRGHIGLLPNVINM